MNENEKNVNENPEENVKDEISEVNGQTVQNEQEVNENKNTKPKNKKILTFSLVGGIAVVAIIIIAIIIACFAGKPSKSKSEEIIKDYLAAINDKSEDEFAKVIDTKDILYTKKKAKKSLIKNMMIKNI